MKITINGHYLKPKDVSLILENLEEEYGLKLRDLTMYVRFIDESGKIVEPKLPGTGEKELILSINKRDIPRDITPKIKMYYETPLSKEKEKIVFEEIVKIIENVWTGSLNKIEKEKLLKFVMLGLTKEFILKQVAEMLLKTNMRFSIPYLTKMIDHQIFMYKE